MSGFRATGKGYYNLFPKGAEADERTASGVLYNKHLKGVQNGRNSKLFLYVTSVGSSWTLAGNKSQTQARSTFYPQHLTQAPVIVKGQCATQYEYDRLVEFVHCHHKSALGLSESNGTAMEGAFHDDIRSSSINRSGRDDSSRGVEFRVMSSFGENGQNAGLNLYVEPPAGLSPQQMEQWVHRYKKGRLQLPPVHIEGYITEMRVGAERFKNSPTFELSIKVSHDFLQSRHTDYRDVSAAFQNYKKGLASSWYEPLSDMAEKIADSIYSSGLGESMEGAIPLFSDETSAAWDALNLENGISDD